MSKLGFMLFIALIVVGIIWWKKSPSKIVALTSKKCVFSFDDQYSKHFQEGVQQVMHAWYQDQEPLDNIITKTIREYPQVAAVQAQVCGADQICFVVEGALPVCLVNDVHVITANGAMVPKQDFDVQLVSRLPTVQTQKLDAPMLIKRFVENLDHDVAADHIVIWHNAHHVVLQPRGVQDMHCVACLDRIPSKKDVQHCHRLHQNYIAHQSKRRKRGLVEYDIRFRNQIISRLGG